MSSDTPISWWRTEFGEPAIEAIAAAIRSERVGQGPLTEAFERDFAERLGMKYAVTVTSGSAALYIALIARGIGHGDEVIVPDRTWVASAHAVCMTGAKVVLADVKPHMPIIEEEVIESLITPRTKAIMPVHLNGRASNMDRILEIAGRHKLWVVEDTCQALFSGDSAGKFLGTRSGAGCFSLGTTKLISSGQGGVVVTDDPEYHKCLKLVKNHGVVDQFTDRWNQFGFNFKFTDFQAAMVHQQLKTIESRLLHLREVYAAYRDSVEKLSWINLIPFGSSNELPLYVDAVTPHRERLISYLREKSIQVRPHPPSLHTTSYLNSGGAFANSLRFNREGLYLPAGPTQPIQNIERVIDALRKFEP